MNWRHKITHTNGHQPRTGSILSLSLIIALLTWLSTNVITALNINYLPLPEGEVRIWDILVIASVIAIPIAFISPYLKLSSRITAPITWLGYILCGFLSSLFILTILGFFLAEFSSVLFPGLKNNFPTFYAQWAIIIALFFTILGWMNARGSHVIEKQNITLPQKTKHSSSLRLVQISDLHIGNTVGPRFMKKLVRRINALSPDIVVLTGDTADGSPEDLKRSSSLLASINAPLGKFAVLGNHDYYSGADAWTEELRTNGFTVLNNANKIIKAGHFKFAIAGIVDHDASKYHPTHKPNPEEAIIGLSPEIPIIMLAHQPRSADIMPSERILIQLSGHTHAGQFWPFRHFVRFQQPIVAGLSGLFAHPVYVSRGTGYWGPPKRIFSRPEITLFTVKGSSQ